jgi:hypothetical protein
MGRMTAVETPARPAKPEKAKANPYPWYSPRFWHGMRPGAFFKLASEHRWRLVWYRWPMVGTIAPLTWFNSTMAGIQHLWCGRKIAETEIKEPPVFIIGHWRSGTTFLHELMHLDERFGSPTTYECFAPHHCILTEWWVTLFFFWLMPRQRPMDNMVMGWSRPQEDEFALLTLGAPTPYLRMAFPNDGPVCMEFLDMQGCSADDLARFEQALTHFARIITYKTEKRLLFKSPPHTGRVEVLAKLFPGAKFIHITRNPESLFPSTVRLWESLDDVQALQRPKHEGLEEYVFECLTRMYRGFEDQRPRLDPANIIDLRYEDLVADPVGEVERIYQRLNLGDFEPVREKLTAFVGEQKDYQTNKHSLDPGLREKIRERWASYRERYGY